MRLLILGSAVLMFASTGCVSREHNEVKAAREAYERCVEEYTDSYPDCVILQDRFLESQRRYHDSSRRAWSCDPAQEECPTPR
jgi:hypothetical protein